ncbi:hypothetical protein FGO68_gene3805 [Halteria grandinella]|uniref:Uncharacterized protein n=1 Tax=Halteria grandinella TaxID=5974 RepID=A0A8J8SVJ6_HALGN|nr:hypothetical protein FGO68_gene3805 [Halteria grandinella]
MSAQVTSTIPEKIPLVKLEDEQVRYEGERLNYIGRVFITKYGEGQRGIWEYAKVRDPSQVYLSVALIAKDAASDQNVLIIKKEKHLSTHEGTALVGLHFELIDDAVKEYPQEAISIISAKFGIKSENLEVVTASPSAYYTDPWKSDEKVKTVVLKTSLKIDVSSLPKDETHQYFSIPLIDGVQALIDLAKKEDTAIDCDIYQLLYGLSIGIALQGLSA